MVEPQLSPIKGGWAALGAGWAVFGESKDEALVKYREADELHRIIEERPIPVAPADNEQASEPA